MAYYFFDVDGTLFDNRSMSVPESAIKALKKLQDKGHKLVICSGRGIGGIKEVKALDVLPWDGYITYNGALTYDVNLNIIKEVAFSDEMCEEIEKVSQQYGHVIFYQGYERWINRELNDMARKGFAFFTKKVDYPIIPYDHQKVHMAAIFNDTFDMYKHIKGLSVLATEYFYSDLVRSDVDKGTGMKAFMDHYHLKKEDTIAFGDGINDIEMMENAGLSIAMGQGRKEVKDISDYVTTAVYDDGIYNALKHFRMI